MVENSNSNNYVKFEFSITEYTNQINNKDKNTNFKDFKFLTIGNTGDNYDLRLKIRDFQLNNLLKECPNDNILSAQLNDVEDDFQKFNNKNLFTDNYFWLVISINNYCIKNNSINEEKGDNDDREINEFILKGNFTIVGVIGLSLCKISERGCEIHTFSVDKEFRFLGIGKFLFDCANKFALDYCLLNSYDKFFIEVLTTDFFKSACAFYLKEGFIINEEKSFDIYAINGIWHREIDDGTLNSKFDKCKLIWMYKSINLRIK